MHETVKWSANDRKSMIERLKLLGIINQHGLLKASLDDIVSTAVCCHEGLDKALAGIGGAELEGALARLREGERSAVLWKGACTDHPQCDTPYRGLQSLSALKLPSSSFPIDSAALIVAASLKPRSINSQQNIDSFGTDLKVPSLPFHIDRGSHFTILACLRSNDVRSNALLDFNHLASLVARPALLFDQAFFNAQEQKNNPELFAILEHEERGNRFVLSKDLIDRRGTFECGCLSSPSSEHRLALEDLTLQIRSFDELLFDETTEQRKVTQKVLDKVCLDAGDLLIINNRIALHGRYAGCLSDPTQNRWLRVVFMEA